MRLEHWTDRYDILSGNLPQKTQLDDSLFLFQLGVTTNLRFFFSMLLKLLDKAQNNGQQVSGHDDRPNIF